MTEVVKDKILKYFEVQRFNVGNALLYGPFQAYTLKNFNQNERDSIPLALESLIADGSLEIHGSDIVVTLNGYHKIYPLSSDEVLEWVKKDIVSFMRSFNLTLGNAFPFQSYISTRTVNYNPPQLNSIDDAFSYLVSDGILDKNGDNYYLTEFGVKKLYV